MKEPGFRRSVAAGLALAALCALPAPAVAVLSGHNGRIVFASGRGDPAANDNTAKLYLRGAYGFDSSGITGEPVAGFEGVQHRHPTWSPDRTKIAYARGNATTADFDIFILDLTVPGAVADNITDSPGVTDDRPAWSPDGTRIAYESEDQNGSNQVNIKMYTVATGIAINFTDQTAGFETKPAWTPDSEELYYTVGDLMAANAMDIVKQPADSPGAAPMNVLANPALSEFQPSISPDGTQMCFTRGTNFGNPDSRVFTALSNGGGQMAIPENVFSMGLASYNCTWSPQGNKLAYVAGTFSSGDLIVQDSDADGGNPFLLEVSGDDMHFDGNPDWAPDGTPTCEDVTVATSFNTPVEIPLECTDVGPAYERTLLTATLGCFPCTTPADGTLGDIEQGDPATVTYTPDAGFSGTDSFVFGVFDLVQFGESATATINVAGPGGGQPGGGGGPGAPGGPGAGNDVTASTISDVDVEPRVWRRGPGLPELLAAQAPVGMTISWRLSEAARTTLRFQRARPGRRVGRRCLRPTPQRLSRPRCTRFRRAGRRTIPNARAGLNEVRFAGRLTRRRRLGLGTHRVVVAAVDAAGNASQPVRSQTFRIVAR